MEKHFPSWLFWSFSVVDCPDHRWRCISAWLTFNLFCRSSKSEKKRKIINGWTGWIIFCWWWWIFILIIPFAVVGGARIGRHLPHDESFAFKNTRVLTVAYHALSRSLSALSVVRSFALFFSLSFSFEIINQSRNSRSNRIACCCCFEAAAAAAAVSFEQKATRGSLSLFGLLLL